jgi:hypothetical protein
MDLQAFIILGGFIAAAAIYKGYSSGKRESEVESKKKVYHYSKKTFLMSKSESEFFNALSTVVPQEYSVFPQIHLSSIVDHKVKGQNWAAALRTINQKSVDFVLCDKPFNRPVLAIELDDWSHEKQDRVERDSLVESILKEAELPLLRINNWRDLSTEELDQKIASALPAVAKPA